MNKGDLIEKGTGGITKLTNTAHQKTLAFCLIVALIVIFWQRYDNNILLNRFLNETSALNEKRVEELKGIVKKEVGSQVKPIADKVDTIKQTADSTFRNINNKL